MKKILAGAAVFATATVGALASYSSASAVTIFDLTDNLQNSTYVAYDNDAQISWPAVDGVVSYGIFMYSPTLDYYSLANPYQGQNTYVNVFELVTSFCSSLPVQCPDSGNSDYPFVIVGYDQNGKIIAYTDEYTLSEKYPYSAPPYITITYRNDLNYTPTEYHTVTPDYNGGIVPGVWTDAGYTGTLTAGKGLIYFTPESTSFADDNSTPENDPYMNYKLRAPSGKTFDAVEINGVRYEQNQPFLVNINLTMKYLWKNIDGSADAPTTEGEANPDTLDISPAATVIFASCLAAGAFALIRKSARR